MMEFSVFHDADLNLWVNVLGYLGIALVIFGETGLFFCFFLPGDSLLFTAGLLASRGMLNIYWLIPILAIAAFLGYWVGYLIGVYLGHWLSRREDSWYFKKNHLEKARLFYGKYGRTALLVGRLIPIARSFIPLVAGMVTMPFWIYSLYNFLGALIWVGLIVLLGYYLGAFIPHSSAYLWLVVSGIVAVSIAPAIIQWCKKKFS